MVVKMKPDWSWCNDKAGNDAAGDKRVSHGIDDRLERSGETKQFMRTFDPKKDREYYGPTTNQARVDGAQRVTSNSKSPGVIKNTDKGYRGTDA